MKKFSLKLLLFSSPFLLAIGLELFVFPIDFFTFRPLEALVVKKFDSLLPGKFYPNRTVIREEEGDLGHHSKYALRKMVEWTTDSCGYRKKETGRLKFDVVIIGQSETFGAGLTQKEMLSELLEERLNQEVYPFAPAGVNTFLKEKRFAIHPPKIVIVTSMTRGIFLLPPLNASLARAYPSNDTGQRLIETLRQKRWFQSAGVFLDRLYKMNMLHYFKASLERMFSGHQKISLNRVETKFGPILFLEGARANDQVPEEKLDRVVETIKSYDHLFKSRGMRFIFVPIPEKENIFYDFLGTPKPAFLERLVAHLKQSGVETVDVPKAFEDEYRRHSTMLYFSDDTHWNARGAQLAADLTARLIEKNDERSNSIR
jgi:lysophospholipase L1-like esterase